MTSRLGPWSLVLACAVARADPAPVPTFAPPLADATESASKKSARSDQPLRLRIPLGTVMSVHLAEAVTLDAIAGPSEDRLLRRLLRDRTNWEEHPMDPRPLAVLRAAMTAFGARRVEIVSGYRSDKLNEMLRKKGRHVARQSQHVLGSAVDFRLVGVATRDLLRFVRANHRGGVGFYPSSGFVHVDSGPRRQWRGE